LAYTYIIIILLYFLGIIFIQKRLKYTITLLVVLLLLALSSYYSFLALVRDGNEPIIFSLFIKGVIEIPLVIDKISGFFILTVNFTLLTSCIYAGKYLSAYKHEKTPTGFSIHYAALVLLHISMLLVCMLREAFYFLAAWELMTLSSFLLVIFDAGERHTLKTGIQYLIQMHVGMFLLLIAFLMTSGPGTDPGFGALPGYFQSHRNLPVFLLFFAGFGIKAGFVPFHTWLPNAHPAAPSHVSGLMSGVMIKMGIYGIVRVILTLHSEFFGIGLFILAVSLLTGLYGVMQAIVQHDLKKLLAYHSIENIGIIGIGLGLGCLGLAYHNQLLAVLGFTGGLLHVTNHSLFKSLLFFASGNINQATHTRDINLLGGLMKKMPVTAGFFLLGSVAICGLPPFNGFISEYLIYLGIISNLHHADFNIALILILTLLGLALIGGLAVFCFTKATGVVFLGEARSERARNARESISLNWIPFSLIAFLIIAIGTLPLVFVDPLLQMVRDCFGEPLKSMSSFGIGSSFLRMSLVIGVFLHLTVAIILVRYRMTARKSLTYGPTWGCGYTAPNTRMQYTASSFSDNFSSLAGNVVNVKKEIQPITGEDIFPGKRNYSSHSSELMETWLIEKPTAWMRKLLRNIAILQTGQIQHYILYPFIFILIILILTVFNIL
jgi:hydrogenase-4 component B